MDCMLLKQALTEFFLIVVGLQIWFCIFRWEFRCEPEMEEGVPARALQHISGSVWSWDQYMEIRTRPAKCSVWGRSVNVVFILMIAYCNILILMILYCTVFILIFGYCAVFVLMIGYCYVLILRIGYCNVRVLKILYRAWEWTH